MKLPDIMPEWRTATVIELCRSIREAQDYSALPILADALQDAGCPDGADELTRLRGTLPRVEAEALVACVMSTETEQAVRWLVDFANGNDCPSYEPLMSAATGHHEENNRDDDYCFSRIAHWDESYLHFNGSDAHGPIPDEFWTHVELVYGKPIRDKPSNFSCSC